VTTAFSVRSNRGSDALSIVADSHDYWRAIIACGDLNSVVRFYEPELSSLRAYFAELARSWTGWDGDKAWSSLEGELLLTAVHDRLGTVGLVLRLRAGPWEFRSPRWLAEAQLLLDAGSLDALAEAATCLARA
jgi:Family of unknown function (DUF6228)